MMTPEYDKRKLRPADLMLSEAVDGLHASPDATARAIGYALHRRHGGDASRLADLVVGAVQEAQRAPAMPVVDVEYIEPHIEPALSTTTTTRWIWAGGAVIVAAALFVSIAVVPVAQPFEPGPGYDVCKEKGC